MSTRRQKSTRERNKLTRKLTKRKIREASGFPVHSPVIETRSGDEICVKKLVDDTTASKYKGFDVSKEMSKKHTLFTKKTIVRDCDTNEIVLVYVPNAFQKETIENAVRVLEKYAPVTGFRGEAAGKADAENLLRNTGGKDLKVDAPKNASWARIIRKTGSNIALSNYVMSGNIGFYKRKRLHTLRKADTPNEETQALLDESIGLVQKEAPELYTRMYSAIYDKYRYGGKLSPFTTLTVNRNFRTAMHRDKGNLNGYAVLTASFVGKPYKRGYLHFPQYGIAVPLRKGDGLIANVNLLHGNEEIVYPDEESGRVSFVVYAREEFSKGNTSAKKEEAEKTDDKT
jgi:hypothetical protein